jgi:hypothetical protein
MMRELGLGLGEAVGQVAGHDYSQIFFLDNPSDTRFFWKQFLAGVFISIATTGLDQDMMQRTLSCKSPRDSQKNLVISVFSQAVVIFLFLFLGVLFYIYLAGKGVTPAAEGFFPMSDAAGAPIISESDEVFSYIATKSGLPLIVGILFVLGLISSTYSAAGSALTALTTSFTIDVLGGAKRYDDNRLTVVRKRVHICMAVAMFAVICALFVVGSSNVIDAVYTLASYTYGLILGLFAFGILTKWRVRGKYVGIVAVVAPILCFILLQRSEAWFNGYKFSYELLIVNALITFVGLMLLIKRNKE